MRQAAFVGVGAMVGAGILALLGAAGEVAGAAVWLSLLIAGAIAGLQGHSFPGSGARYTMAGGLLGYAAKGFGDSVVFRIPTLFPVVTLVNKDRSLLAPSTSSAPRSGL